MDAPLTLNELFQLDRYRHQRGIVGLADDLLTFCGERRAKITWQSGEVVAWPLKGGHAERIAVELRVPLFRSVLARLSALCNEQQLERGSPYGGQGEFAVERMPNVRFRLDFTNTPDEQRLELLPVIVSEIEGGTGRGETRSTIQPEHSEY